MTEPTPPRWDLTNVYPSLEAPALSADFENSSRNDQHAGDFPCCAA